MLPASKIRTGKKAHMPFSDGQKFLFINEGSSQFSTKDIVTFDLLSACILHGAEQCVSACDATVSAPASWYMEKECTASRLLCITHKLSCSLILADKQVVTLGH